MCSLRTNQSSSVEIHTSSLNQQLKIYENEILSLKNLLENREVLVTKALGKINNLQPYLGLDIQTGPFNGIKVTSLTSNSPASIAGLLKNDIIERAGNDSIRSGLDFRAVLGKIKPGDQLPVTIQVKNIQS